MLSPARSSGAERRRRCGSGRRPPIGSALDDLADRFNEAGEHIPRSAHPARAAARDGSRRPARERAPARPTSVLPAAPSTCGVDETARTKSTSPSSQQPRERRPAFERAANSIARAAQHAPTPRARSLPRPHRRSAPAVSSARPGRRSACCRAVVTIMTGPASRCREQPGGGRDAQPAVEHDTRARAVRDRRPGRSAADRQR